MATDWQGNWIDEGSGGALGAIGSWLGLGGGGQPAPPEAPPLLAPAVPSPAATDEGEPDELTRAEIRQTNAQAAAAEALAEQRRAELARAGSPEAQARAQAEVAKAQTEASTASLQLQRALVQLSPQAQARLEHELALEREILKERFAAEREQRQATESRDLLGLREAGESARLDRQLGSQAALQSERLGFERAEGEATRRQQAVQSMLSAGVSLRGQELDRLRAQDELALRLMANKVAQGELSVSRATNLFNAHLARARLPIEIFQARSQAVQPFIPYLTAMREGESFPGFEAGGPMEATYKMAGLDYDPKRFAARPQTVDINALYGDLRGAKVPDPSSIFPGELRLPGPSSALAGAQLPSVAPLLQNLMPGPGAPNEQDTARMQKFIEGLR